MISGEDCEFIQRFEQKRNPEEKQELLQTEGNQVTFLSFNDLSLGEEHGRTFSYQLYFAVGCIQLRCYGRSIKLVIMTLFFLHIGWTFF